MFLLLLCILCIKVCSDTADVWNSLEFVSRKREWYTAGVRLADVIASEEDTLRLCSILNK